MSIKKSIKKDTFHHHFQPIWNLDSDRIIGYEALLRSQKYLNPEKAFDKAKKEKRLYELDTHSIFKAVSSYQSAGLTKREGKVFVNVFPSTILHPDFLALINQMTQGTYQDRQQIVIEISEIEIIKDFEVFKRKITELKQQGLLIAVDDVGSGFASVKPLIELEPDYVKLDRFFSEDLDTHEQKQSFVSFFVNHFEEFKSKLILEGVETEVELQTAKELGVSMAQGYLLGRPVGLNWLLGTN